MSVGNIAESAALVLFGLHVAAGHLAIRHHKAITQVGHLEARERGSMSETHVRERKYVRLRQEDESALYVIAVWLVCRRENYFPRVSK